MSSQPIPEIPADETIASALALLQDRGTEILNAIDDGIFFLDSIGRLIFINEAAVRLLGFTNREMLGRSMHEMTHHHYADGSVFPIDECPIQMAVTDGVQQRVGGDMFWTKGGTLVLVDYTAIPIRHSRKIVGAVVTFRDVTDASRLAEQGERLKREQALRADAESARESLRTSEARYRFLAEAIPVLVWTAQPDGSLDYVTQKVADYFGKTTEELLRDGWQDVVHPEDLPFVGERWGNSLATGEPYKVEFRLLAADGTYRWHLARALPQRNEAGEIVQWFGTNTDIDDQKRAPLHGQQSRA